MRGTHSSISNWTCGRGIIPAYAGNTNLQGIGIAQWRDHPRVCGEHDLRALRLNRILGSSPRMRGTPLESCENRRQTGIIPAYAGNTVIFDWGDAFKWDHPRVCGEHVHFDRQRGYSAGSSPRMRGTHRQCRNVRRVFGIIPAYAGNTCTVPKCHVTIGDHPRVCGEHFT